MINIENGSTVTLAGLNPNASNTYIVDRNEGDGNVLLSHPLSGVCLMRVPEDMLNRESPRVKDSTERSLDFCNNNPECIKPQDRVNLKSLKMTFFFERELSDKQKKVLSDVCGRIASFRLRGDLNEAMSLIVRNEGLLDEFNLRWYRNFHKIFEGNQEITSQKQTDSIFNMAGFVMAELGNQYS